MATAPRAPFPPYWSPPIFLWTVYRFSPVSLSSRPAASVQHTTRVGRAAVPPLVYDRLDLQRTTTGAYGLRRSATTSNGFGTSSSSSSSYSLMHSRSSSNLRRPSFGLSRVSSHSTLERKPAHLSMKVRTMEA
ncbi:hypothetical protein Y032_0551g3327 [Ancylostoma ceylanicum]|uniref:Uncharacterized protein n=1 Tax=Ancylostoma ceylanicum TaxID=53326 RepID=A0A016WRM2_9BILA|nr:hypothetical protein Y032_0551g3327 [Ancylostoma ceylanicum]